jgi:F-type H+-transporting ATPase subunit epsilon
MASTIPFKLITPRRVVFEGAASLVIAVTTEGEEGILPSHAPFLAALKPGILRANVAGDGGETRLEVATGEGFMQALPDRLTVLVDEVVKSSLPPPSASARPAAIERHSLENNPLSTSPTRSFG